jgi:hypothetical protein
VHPGRRQRAIGVIFAERIAQRKMSLYAHRRRSDQPSSTAVRRDVSASSRIAVRSLLHRGDVAAHIRDARRAVSPRAATRCTRRDGAWRRAPRRTSWYRCRTCCRLMNDRHVALPVLDTVEPLPSPYASWLAELWPAGIPRESRATCDPCVMCNATGTPQTSATLFRADTKCCTRLPLLPNFLVGACLLDTTTPRAQRGRRTVIERIERDASATPLALRPSAPDELMHRALDRNVLGASRAMRCPHYLDEDGGVCGIWRHRNAACATWFCKHERGMVGREFWRDVQQLLAAIEHELSAWCALELGCDPSALQAALDLHAEKLEVLAARDLSLRFDAERSRRLWGTWCDRKVAFYEQCAVLVRALGWEDVLRVTGPVVRARVAIAAAAYERLVAPGPLPERLLEHGFVVVQPAGGGRARVSLFHETDPIEISERLLGVLHYFDGRRTADALADIARRGISLEPSLVRRLVDFGVLRAVEVEERRRESAGT